MQVFLVKFMYEGAYNSNIVAAILNSTQQVGRVFLTSFRARDFIQTAPDKPFDYHSGLWLLLSQMCPKL